MKRLIAAIIALLTLFSLYGCKRGVEGEEASSESETGIVVNDVDESTPEAEGAKKAAAELLDIFISGDIDAIRDFLQDDDEKFFDFDSEEQCEFYREIFPRIKYEFEYVSEHDGVYGVMTKITSPNMGEVYGRIITSYMDMAGSTEDYTEEDLRRRNTEIMREALSEEENFPKREEELYIYIERDGEKFVPRCDVYLSNELVGGAAEVSEELSSSITEMIDAISEEAVTE